MVAFQRGGMRGCYFFMALCLLFMLSAPSYALKCTSLDNNVSVRVMVETTFAVPNSLPQKMVLWRQVTQTLEAKCWVDVRGFKEENVYFYLDPKKVDLGPDMDVGVTYNGVDYIKSELSGGKLDTGVGVLACKWDEIKKECVQDKTIVKFKYSVFLSKKSAKGPPKEGALSVVQSFMAFQFDGKNDVRPGASYNLTVNGLNKIRYIPCESKISIAPNFIDFDGVPASSAQVGRVIRSLPFVISEQRGCSAAYGVNLAFHPKNVRDSTDNTLIVPGNNRSLGVRIVDAEKNKALVLRKEYEFSPVGSGLFYSKRFLAELSWLSQTPQLGRF
ncbi:fimbrial protein, partial [Pseudomonas sp. MWU13-2860]